MTDNSLRLGVNIDHVATLREARKTRYPDTVEAARLAITAGAQGITIHLREDRRHIQDHDLENLLKTVTVPLNLELAVTDEMLSIAERTCPPHVCLVPERREEITTEGGLDVVAQQQRIADAISRLEGAGIRVSLFIDAEEAQIAAAKTAGAPVIELHTGAYANAGESKLEAEVQRIVKGAKQAADIGLEVHAGHGLTVDNVGAIAAIQEIRELNIGHAIIARAIFVGLPEAVREMWQAMDKGRSKS